MTKAQRDPRLVQADKEYEEWLKKQAEKKRSRAYLLRKSKAHLVLVEEHDDHGHLIHRWKRDGVEHIERVADKLAFIDHGEPIASVNGNEVPPDTPYKELKIMVADYWQQKFNSVSRNPILGAVNIDKKAAGFAIGHGMNELKQHALFIIPEVIEKGKVLGELPPEPTKPRAFVIGAPIAIGGEHYKMLIEVRRDINMQRMYLYEVILRKNNPSSAFVNPAASPLKEAEPQVATRGAIYNLLHSLRNNKFSKSIADNYIKTTAQHDNHKRIQHPLMLVKSRQLHGRIDFNGLQVSIETGRSRCREWHNPHDGSQGMSRMSLPYGYIRSSQGVDLDHFDCFVGADRTAPNVYIVTTMKAPDFAEVDEQKAILGVQTAEEAKRVFHASYNDPRFFGTMTEMPFEEFKQQVLATKDEPKLLAGELVKATPFVRNVREEWRRVTKGK
jgi:hypothetical protein